MVVTPTAVSTEGNPPYGNVELSGVGGGASDVRVGGFTNACAAQLKCSLSDRIVVAGGGGGGGATGNGAVGGARREAPRGRGAVQEGYLGTCGTGTQATFGCGANSFAVTDGGGGGGWYGGSPGGSRGSSGDPVPDGGGGGSGYVSRRPHRAPSPAEPGWVTAAS